MVRRIRIAVALLLMVTAAAILIVLQQRLNPVYVKVPTQMTAMIRQFAQADGDGQILAGPSALQAASARYVQLAASHPARLSLSQDAAHSIVAMISRDRNATLYTRRVSGFSWDSIQVQVSAPRIAPRTGDSLTFVATITWWFHINGTDRGDGDPGGFSAASGADYSGTSAPYVVGFIRTSHGSWLLASIAPPCPPPTCV